MSLETSIATLVAQAGALLDLPQQMANAATARLGVHQAAWDARLASLEAIYHVHQTAGSDVNQGLAASPLQSVQQAIDRTPRGGAVTVYFQSAYNFSAIVDLKGRHVRLMSDGTERRALTFDRSYALDTSQQRILQSFRSPSGSSLAIGTLRVVMPDGAPYAANPDWGNAALVKAPYPNCIVNLSLINSDIDLPATPFGPLVNPGAANILAVVNCTAVGQPLNGRVIGGQTAGAGVAASSMPNLLTNLATV